MYRTNGISVFGNKSFCFCFWYEGFDVSLYSLRLSATQNQGTFRSYYNDVRIPKVLIIYSILYIPDSLWFIGSLFEISMIYNFVIFDFTSEQQPLSV